MTEIQSAEIPTSAEIPITEIQITETQITGLQKYWLNKSSPILQKLPIIQKSPIVQKSPIFQKSPTIQKSPILQTSPIVHLLKKIIMAESELLVKFVQKYKYLFVNLNNVWGDRQTKKHTDTQTDSHINTMVKGPGQRKSLLIQKFTHNSKVYP